MTRPRNPEDKKRLQTVLSFIRALFSQPGLYITIKDPKTGGKLVIFRKASEPEIHFSEEWKN